MSATRLMSSRVFGVIFFVGCVVLALASVAPACTSFCLEDSGHLVFGKNYDWHMDHGLIIVNKRGIARIIKICTGSNCR